MPHGMFKKCLLEEARVETVFVTARGPLAHVEKVIPAAAGTTITHNNEMLSSRCLLEEARVETVFVTARGPLAHVEEVTPATAGTTITQDDEMLSSGTEVVIEGLTRAPAFNGRRGVIQSLDEEIGRYTILLSSPGSSGGRQWAKVKRENLRL